MVTRRRTYSYNSCGVKAVAPVSVRFLRIQLLPQSR
jgi:hypothetical protein